MEALERLAASAERIADAQAPVPADKVGTPYVADRLGCTKEYVSQMAREGTIPKGCIVQGTGWGKPWKFHRGQIDKWIETRR